MSGYTYRIICLWFCLLFGVAWLWLTWRNSSMYVPPGEIQAFLTALLAGKLTQTLKP